jgi:hypothetical protein
VPEANHFFEEGMDTLIETVDSYMRMRLAETAEA